MAAANRVKVVVRVRPFNSNERKADVPCIVSMDGNATHLLDPSCLLDASPPLPPPPHHHGGGGGVPSAMAVAVLPPSITPEQRALWTRTFRFDDSLLSIERGAPGYCSQAATFERVGRELVASALAGFNATLLA